MNISIVNGFVLQNEQTDRYHRRRHFDFRLLLAKQLLSDFNGFKRHSSALVSRSNRAFIWGLASTRPDEFGRVIYRICNV